MPRINGANAHIPFVVTKPPHTQPAPHTRGQSRRHSLIESMFNILIGYCINLGVQAAAFPAFGAHFTIKENLQIGGIFTVFSIFRSYFLRRIFNRITIWRGK